MNWISTILLEKRSLTWIATLSLIRTSICVCFSIEYFWSSISIGLLRLIIWRLILRIYKTSAWRWWRYKVISFIYTYQRFSASILTVSFSHSSSFLSKKVATIRLLLLLIIRRSRYFISWYILILINICSFTAFNILFIRYQLLFLNWIPYQRYRFLLLKWFSLRKNYLGVLLLLGCLRILY